ncbi:2,5-diamino-6-(ribosylamino)-4(3H)-pyrimidinone 5'-phosphate reductase [Monosporozyma unispora]|nr:2,5-diamino-6-(ribosylamino)-4(3H)-pyrimidinone 5'-phosphate reductase [Kazachstania unispora]
MSLQPLRPNLPAFLDPYLPKNKANGRPFITLTYAQSLDSRISKGQGQRTIISHEETKTMTHYLRAHHDGILVGTGTVLADNPGLNSKWTPPTKTVPTTMSESPRPIIIDMRQEWKFAGSKMWELYNAKQGKAPIVIVQDEPQVREPDVTYIVIGQPQFEWGSLLKKLREDYGIYSLMVEGGASVIQQLLLRPDLVDSLIITIGSTFLGVHGVEVSPEKPLNVENVDWWKGTRDSVMCATLCHD